MSKQMLRSQLIMIRHGRPHWFPERFVSLERQQHLSEAYDDTLLLRDGTNALITLAEQLPEAPIVSSDLPRAKETAEILANLKGIPVEFKSLLREIKGPRIKMGFLGEMRAPSVFWSAVRSCCWLAGIGECREWPANAWDRVGLAAEYLRSRLERDGTLIMVSHGWFMIMLAVYLRRHKLVDKGPLVPRLDFGAATVYFLR